MWRRQGSSSIACGPSLRPLLRMYALDRVVGVSPVPYLRPASPACGDRLILPDTTSSTCRHSSQPSPTLSVRECLVAVAPWVRSVMMASRRPVLLAALRRAGQAIIRTKADGPPIRRRQHPDVMVVQAPCRPPLHWVCKRPYDVHFLFACVHSPIFTCSPGHTGQ